MIPIKDLNKSGSFPFVVLIIIILNAIVFAYELSLPAQAQAAFFKAFGMTPKNLTYLALGESGGGLIPWWATLFTYMFLHGGWLHVIFNLWFLWIFGDNVEDMLGHARFALFYVSCGVGSAVAEAFFSANADVPIIGASGAIAGVMGAYLWLFPTARIVTLVWIIVIFFFVRIPAVIFLGLWFALQVFNGSGSYAADGSSGGIAWFAHAGGFVIGIVLILTLFRPVKKKKFIKEE